VDELMREMAEVSGKLLDISFKAEQAHIKEEAREAYVKEGACRCCYYTIVCPCCCCFHYYCTTTALLLPHYYYPLTN
jgi:hypothetical protein